MDQTTRRRGRPKGFNSPTSKTTIQSLDRAFDVLDCLAARDGLTLTDIAETLDQSPATIHRVLATLEVRGIVDSDTGTQTWFIGAMAYRIGSAFLRRAGVVERARASMRELMQSTGETANLGIEQAGQVMFISQVETPQTIRAFFPPGTVSPMHASGIGKALLAQYSEDRMAAFLNAHALTRFTDRTITDPDALRQDMDLTRARGWACDDEEKAAGMRCVAAPIFNIFAEPVAGISVSGPTHRMDLARIEEIGTMVREAAAAVSRALGAETGKPPQAADQAAS